MNGSFFDRFVHPRVARVATAGAVVWVGSFGIALGGLVARGWEPRLAGLLFFLSGVVGLLGMLLLGGCVAYLGAKRLRSG